MIPTAWDGSRHVWHKRDDSVECAAEHMTMGELEHRAAEGDPKAVQALNAFAAESMPMAVDALGAYRHAEAQVARLTEEPLVAAQHQNARRMERRERMMLGFAAVPCAAAVVTFAVKLLG